jgi:hypothetical protein
MATEILVQAVLSPMEQDALRSAARRLSDCAPITFDLRFLPHLDAVEDIRSVVITSLLAETDPDAAPWATVETRLRAAYLNLSSHPNLTVFICTVLRNVGAGDGAAARLGRIRRLNLLAADISRETGLNVIDIDRTLADIGARALATDYRLGGPFASEVTAKSIALTFLVCGLDDYASYQAQEAARTAIAAYQPKLAEQPQFAPTQLRVRMAEVGLGRRRQNVAAMVALTSPGHQLAGLIRGVLDRRVSPATAIEAVRQVVRRHGIRRSVGMAVTGVMQYLRSPLRRAR